MTAVRKPEGYEVTDCTGVQTGNSDIGVPEWTPTDVRPGTTPLPIYPQPSDLPAPPRTARLALEESRFADVLREIRQMGRSRDPKSRTRDTDPPKPPTYESIQGHLIADGLLPERRRSIQSDAHRAGSQFAVAVGIVLAALIVLGGGHWLADVVAGAVS